MKMTPLIFIFVLVLLSVNVFGAYTPQDNEAFYKLNQNCEDFYNNMDIGENGTLTWLSTPNNYGMEGTDDATDYCCISNSSANGFFDIDLSSRDIAMSARINLASNPSHWLAVVSTRRDPAGARGVTIRIDTNGKYRCDFYGPSAAVGISSDSAMADGNWHTITCNYDNDNSPKGWMIIDGTTQSSTTSTSVGNLATGNCFVIGGFHQSITTCTGDVSDNAEIQNLDIEWVHFIDQTIDATQQGCLNDTDHFNINCDDPPGASPTASVTLSTNLTNGNYTYKPFSFAFNASVSNTADNNFNCSLYLNSSLNQTHAINNISINQIFNLTNDIEEGYEFNITCLNNNATDSFTRYIELDTVPPDLVIDSSFVNGSDYFDNSDVVYVLNVTDTNLFAFNHTIKEPDGTIVRHDFQDNLTTTFYQLNVSNSTAVLGVGNYTITMTAWDSHTSKKLKHKEKIKDNKLEYGNVKFYCDDTELMEYTKEKDKIKPKVTFNKMKKSQVCYYEGNNLIKVNHGYPNHYVDFVNKIWIDDYSAEVVKVNNNKIKLTYRNDKSFKHIQTDSIGDLNEEEKQWEFTVSEAPTADYLIQQDQNNTLTNISATLLDLLDEKKEESNMLLIILPLAFGLFCIIGSVSLSAQHSPVKIALFILSLISVFASAWIGVSISTNTDAELSLARFTNIMGWVVFAIISYFAIYTIYTITRRIAKQKEEKLEY